MADNASWWAAKLNGGQPTQQRPVQQPFQARMAYTPQQPAPAQAIPQEVDAAGNIVVHAGQAAAAWQGTTEAQASTGRCPGCHGPNFFSRTNGITRGPAPMPMCADCGFPLVQSGSPTGELAGVKPTGAGVSKQYSNPNALPMFTVVDRVG